MKLINELGQNLSDDEAAVLLVKKLETSGLPVPEYYTDLANRRNSSTKPN